MAVLAVAACLFVAVGGGVSLAAVSRGLVAVVILHLLRGVPLWRAVRPERGWWVEDLVAGLTLGVHRKNGITADQRAGVRKLKSSIAHS